MFYNGWSGVLRVLAVGVPAYAALLLLIRLGGKRTLSKFNAFDIIITVAFGSSLSAALLNRNLALAEIITAFALLVLLQFLITWTSVRWDGIDRIVRAEPALLYHRGDFADEAMVRERVTKAEIESAVRSQGYPDVADVTSVVLETDGSLSVIGTKSGPGSRGGPLGGS